MDCFLVRCIKYFRFNNNEKIVIIATEKNVWMNSHIPLPHRLPVAVSLLEQPSPVAHQGIGDAAVENARIWFSIDEGSGAGVVGKFVFVGDAGRRAEMTAPVRFIGVLKEDIF